MKLNIKTLCSIGALLLCSESALASEATPWEKSSNRTHYVFNLPTDSLSINEKELSSIESLTIKYSDDDIDPSRLENLSRILAGAKKLQWLKLTNLGLTEIPKEVFDLEDLRGLILHKNNLKDIPSDIERLTKLHMLIIDGDEKLTISSELNNLTNLVYTHSSDYKIAWKDHGGKRVLDLSNKNLTHIPFDISFIRGYGDCMKKLDLQNNDLGPEDSFPNFMVQLMHIEEIDLRNNPKIDSIDKLPTPIFGMSSLKKILLTGTTNDIEYSDVDISSVRKKKIEELNSKISMIDTLMDSHDFVNIPAQLNVKKCIYQNMLDKLEEADKKFKDRSVEAAETTTQVIANESYYSKFGQFFESIWSRFTESRLGRTLKFVKSYFFGNN